MPTRSGKSLGFSVSANELRCPSCGSDAVTTEVIEHRFPYGDGDSAVDLSARVPLRKCQECGEEYLDDESEDLMHETVCRHRGVMTPSQVRAIRQQSGGMSRAEFARITRLGEATIGRWERGELIQNAAYDQLLYLLTYPDNLIRLQERVDPATSQPTAASACGAARRFRLIGVTDDLTERAATFLLNTAGAA